MKVCLLIFSSIIVFATSSAFANLSFSVTDNTPCAGENIIFNWTTSPSVDHYDIISPTNVTYTAFSSPKFIGTYSSVNSGVWVLNAIDINGDIMETSTLNITVNERPVVTPQISVSNNTPCLGDVVTFKAPTISDVTYSWTGPDGFTSNSKTPSVNNIQTPAIGIYSLIITNTSTGCSSVPSANSETLITIKATPVLPIALESSTYSPCVGDTVLLTCPALPGVTYAWTGPNGFSATIQNTTVPNIQVDKSGTYKLIATDISTGCTSVPSLVVLKVNSLPTLSTPVSASNNNPCLNGDVQFSAPTIPNVTYSWTGPNGFTSNQQNPSITNIQAANSGTYSVKITNLTTGCNSLESANTQLSINVKPIPVIDSNIVVSSNTPCLNGTVNFTAQSIAGVTYSWSGPNGFTSNQQNPSIANVQLINNGTYTLTVSNTATGCSSATSSKSSTILEVAPIPEISSPVSVSKNEPCVGEDVTLSAPSIPGVTYSWSGPNGFTSNQQNTTISAIQKSNSGTYTLTVASTATGCSSVSDPNVSQVVVNVKDTPELTVSISASNDKPCENSSITLNAPSIANATYSWSGPNGFTSNVQNPVINNVQLSNNGLYSLVVTNTATTCSSSSTASSQITLNVSAAPVYSFNRSLSACIGDTVDLKGPVGDNTMSTWNGPDNFSSEVGSSGSYAIILQNVANKNIGTYNIKIQNMVTGCITYDSLVLSLKDAPKLTAPISVSNSNPCENSSVTLSAPSLSNTTYSWSGPNGFSSNQQNPIVNNLKISNNGVYTLIIKNTVSGCQSNVNDSAKITLAIISSPSIDPNVPISVNDNTPCLNSTVQFTAPTIAGSTYAWSGPNGFTSNQQNPSINNFEYEDEGTYTLILTDIVTGCSSSSSNASSILVNIIDSKDLANTISTTSNTPCQNSDLTLSIPFTVGSTYSWTGPNGFSSSINNPTISNVQTVNSGKYSVTVLNIQSDCNYTVSGTAQINISVTPAPSLVSQISVSDTTPCINSKVNFYAPYINGVTYLWNGPLGFSSTDQNPTINNFEQENDGIYSVTITDTVTGCSTSSDGSQKLVNVIDSKDLIDKIVPSNLNPCLNENLTLNAPSVPGSTFSWTGPNGFTSTEQNPTITSVTLANSGTYRVFVSNDITDCNYTLQGSAQIEINVNSAPVLNTSVSVSNNTPCLNGTVNFTSPTIAGVTYSWSGPNGFTSNLQNPTINNVQLTDNGTYTLTVTSNATGCSSASTAEAQTTLAVVSAPNLNSNVFASSNTPCLNSTVNFTAPSVAGGTYSWTGPNGFTSNQQNPSIANVQEINNGTYSLTVTNTATGCVSASSANAQVTLTVKPLPTFIGQVSVSNNEPCQFETVNFTAPTISGVSYSWSGPNGFSSTLQNPSIANVQLANNGTYTLTIIDDATECSSETTVSAQTILKIKSAPDLNTSVTASNNTPCINGDVQFNAPSISGATYAWSGPNGFTSNLQNPTITNVQVVNNGTYSLIVTNPATGCSTGSSANASTTLKVSELPTLPSSVGASDNTPCLGGDVTLTGPDAPNTTYSWTGPNGFTSNEKNPNISDLQLTNNGVYTLTITNSATGCSSAVTAIAKTEIAINPLPVVTSSIVASNTTPCTNDEVVFVAPSIPNVTYSWVGPNGYTANTQNATVSNMQAVNSGKYSLIVTSTETGCSNAASANSEVDVTVNARPVIPINSNSKVTRCVGDSLNLVFPSTPNVTYTWIGPNGFTSNEQNPTIEHVTYEDNGTFIVKLKSTITGCEAIDNGSNFTKIEAEIYKLPVFNGLVSASNNTPCLGESVNFTATTIAFTDYEWTGPNGFISTVQNPVISSMAETNDGIYSLRIKNLETGCFSLVTPNGQTALTHKSTPVIATPITVSDNTPCTGEQVAFTAPTLNGVTYSWAGPNGFTSNVQNPMIANVQMVANGDYNLTATDANTGCKSIATSNSKVNLAVNQTPTISLQDSILSCNQDKFNLMLDQYDSYLWSTGETTRGIDVTKKGWYSVNVMNNGCKSVKDSIYVTMFKSDLAINKSQDGCLNDYFEFSATGGENYSWAGPNGFVSSDSIVKFLAVKQSNIGDYKVSVNYSNGCKDSSNFHLGILGDNYCFKIPEIITPNHDGKNDAFVIDWIDQYPNNKLTIVNRWGSTIFEASPYQNDFNGKSNTGLLLDSKNVPSGSYYYILNLDDKTPLKKGVVEIQN